MASASQSGSVNDSPLSLVLGDSNSSGSNQPKIDDVRFYRGILSAADISAIYNNGSGDVGAPKFAITSPATIQGAKGKSISYQIVADAAYGLTGYNAYDHLFSAQCPKLAVSVVYSSGTVTAPHPLQALTLLMSRRSIPSARMSDGYPLGVRLFRLAVRPADHHRFKQRNHPDGLEYARPPVCNRFQRYRQPWIPLQPGTLQWWRSSLYRPIWIRVEVRNCQVEPTRASPMSGSMCPP